MRQSASRAASVAAGQLCLGGWKLAIEFASPSASLVAALGNPNHGSTLFSNRVIALTCVMHGRSNDGGGAFEIPLGFVAVTENGLRTHEYAYQPEERDAMLAKFAELSREPQSTSCGGMAQPTVD